METYVRNAMLACAAFSLISGAAYMAAYSVDAYEWVLGVCRLGFLAGFCGIFSTALAAAIIKFGGK